MCTAARSQLHSVLAAVLLTGLALPAAAEEAALNRALAAGSLHEGPLDMVAYYLPNPDGTLEVTATFAPKMGGEPTRIVMALADGDAVRFGVPGHRGFLYGFARAGAHVALSVSPVPAAKPVAEPSAGSAAGTFVPHRRAEAPNGAAPVRLQLAAGTKQGCPAPTLPPQNPRGGCKAQG